MTINYHEGRIDDKPTPLMERPLYIGDMEPLSEGYIGFKAVWWLTTTKLAINPTELVYQEGDLSIEACPEDWVRIIALPGENNFLVDLSHLEEFQDGEGRFITPLEIFSDDQDDEEAIPFVEANDTIRNDMQLRGAENILRDQYGMLLTKSFLHRLVALQNGIEDDDSDSEDIPPL